AKASNWDLSSGLLGDKSDSVVFDDSKLSRLVSEIATTTRIDQGIRRAVIFILDHPEYQYEDKEFDEWCDRVIAVLYEALVRINNSMKFYPLQKRESSFIVKDFF